MPSFLSNFQGQFSSCVRSGHYCADGARRSDNGQVFWAYVEQILAKALFVIPPLDRYNGSISQLEQQLPLLVWMVGILSIDHFSSQRRQDSQSQQPNEGGE